MTRQIFLLACLISLLTASAWAQTAGMRPGQARVITGTATTNTATAADYNGLIVWRSTSGSAKTQTLPACNASSSGMKIGVVDGQGTASGGNITVAAPSGSSVAGPSTSISTDRGSLEVTCDGTSTWVVTANNSLPGAGGGGGVASITAGTGLTGGTIGAGQSGTIAMPNTTTAGSCTNCDITRDAQGRITSASNGQAGGGGGPAGEVAWRVVVPSGGDDYNNLQNALNTSVKGVILDGSSDGRRIFNVCRTIDVPRNKVLIGTRTGMYWGGTEGAMPSPTWLGGPVLTCGNWNNTQFDYSMYPFGPNNAQIRMHDNTTIEGFAVNGVDRPHPGNDWQSAGVCVNGTNSKGATIRFMVILNCQFGAVFAGSSRAPTDSYGPLSQMQVVNNNTFWYVGHGIYLGKDWGDPGNNWSAADIRIFANEYEIATVMANEFFLTGSAQLHDNRIEDAGGCTIFTNALHTNVHGNQFNDQGCDVVIEGTYPGQYGMTEQMVFTGNVSGSQWPAWGSCWMVYGYVWAVNAANNQCRYGKFGAWWAPEGGTGVDDMTIMDSPMGGTGSGGWDPPIFRDRRTFRDLGSFELMHNFPNTRWATQWTTATGGNGNTIWCCGAPGNPAEGDVGNPNTN